MKTLEKYQRVSVQDFGPWLERFELQEDIKGRFCLLVSGGYQLPHDVRTYRLFDRPERSLAECFPEGDDCFVDTYRDQSADLEFVLGVSVEELEPDRDSLHPEGF